MSFKKVFTDILTIVLSVIMMFYISSCGNRSHLEDKIGVDEGPYSGKIVCAGTINGVMNIYIIDADGTNMRVLTRNTEKSKKYVVPAISPDGRNIIFSIDGDKKQKLYKINETKSVAKLTKKGYSNGFFASYSSDGKKIVFYRTVKVDQAFIYIANADGSNIKRIAKGFLPSFSPDGMKIIFTRIISKKAYILIMNINGKIIKSFKKIRGSVAFYSPDGQKIVLTRLKNDIQDIYIVDTDGSNEKRLTYNLKDDFFASFSPDGRSIIFVSDRQKPRGVYIMDIDGSNKRRLSQAPFSLISPRFAPR